MIKLILFCFICLLFSCSKSDKTSHEKKSVYTLNGTEKWEMDSHTKRSIDNMNTLFQNTAMLSNPADFNKFALSFETELDSMIKGCTMTGKSHDQLHLFIGEIFQPLENLKKDSILTDAKNSFTTLKDALTEYDKFFK